MNKKRKKTKRCGGRPRSIRKQIGQADDVVLARNMSTTGCFLGRAAGPRAARPFINKTRLGTQSDPISADWVGLGGAPQSTPIFEIGRATPIQSARIGGVTPIPIYPALNKKRKKTKKCGGRPRSIRKQIGQVDGAVWALNMSTTGCFLGRAAGRAQRGPLLIKKERRRRDAEAGHDRSVSRSGKQMVPYGRAIC